jgi:hypothetical protein
MKDVREVSSVKTSDIFNGEPFDSCYFKKEEIPEQDIWSYSFLRFSPGTRIWRNEELQTDAWLVVLFEPDKEDDCNVVYYQTYLGDPLVFVKNHVKSDCQGIIIKKSVPGVKILIEMFKGMKLSNIIGQLEIDLNQLENS